MGRKNYRVNRVYRGLFGLLLCVLILFNMVSMPNTQQVQAATKPLIVMLDPGHGGSDSGAARPEKNPTNFERIYNEKIAEACRAELATYDNVVVYLTRVGNVDMTTQARPTYAKRMNADLFISFHINANESSSANGAEIYVPNGNYKPAMATEARALAKKILDQFASLELPGYGLSGDRLKIRDDNDDGIKTKSIKDDIRLFYPDGTPGDYFEVIRLGVQNEIPSMIIEHAFISNAADLAMLNDDAALEKLGKATATAIAQQYGLQKTGKSLPQPELKAQTTGVSLGGIKPPKDAGKQNSSNNPAVYMVGEAPITLMASGGNGTGEFIFNSNNPKVVRIEGNQAYFVGAGKVLLSVTRYEDHEYAPRSLAFRLAVEIQGVETTLNLTVADNYRTGDGKQNVVLVCVPQSGTEHGAIPSGTVTFYEGETKLGTGVFKEDGRCTFVAKNLDPGAYTFKAFYESGNFDGFTIKDPATVSYGVEVTKPTATPAETDTPEEVTPEASQDVPSHKDNSGNGFLGLLSNRAVIIVFAIAAGLILAAIVILVVCRFRP